MTAAATPLIPREILFGTPERAAPALSPDGEALAFLAIADGVQNLYVGPASAPEAAEPVTRDRGRGIQLYTWTYDPDYLLYLQDLHGNENWHVYALRRSTGAVRDLTPFEAVSARIQHVSPDHPGEALLAINDRAAEWHDVYRVRLDTGARRRVQLNDGFSGFVTDDAFRVRFAIRAEQDGGVSYLRRSAGDAWKSFLEVPPEDVLTTALLDFDKRRRQVFALDSRGRDTSALVRIDLDSGEPTVLAADERCDIDHVLLHPTEKTLQAVSRNYERREWSIFDPGLRADFDYLRSAARGELRVISRTLDDRQWIVAYLNDDGPLDFYAFERGSRHAKFLFSNQPRLADVALSRMRPVRIRSRDGLDLVSYLSLPPWSERAGTGRPSAPLPMVLMVHGGPWSRVEWGFNPGLQWLNNRGYAALAVNFRGSTGFGKAFVNAGDREWGGKMHDDLLDAVDWAVAEGVADPERVAVFGASFGGYAALVGLTRTPERFACGVSMFGPSNLVSFLETLPPYWAAALALFRRRVGDPGTEEGRRRLAERSPLSHIDMLVRPLLVAHGAHDVRVPQSESEQLVRALGDRGVEVVYALYPDEGHGFARPENSCSFFALAERFLAKTLGGRSEPFGEELERSSVELRAGGAILGL